MKIAQTVELLPGTERIVVTAWGNVVPAHEMTVKPQVSGQVVSIHEALVPGGRLPTGAKLLGIDPSDYHHNLAERTAELANARADLETEMGRQAIAKREWERLQAEIPDSDTNPALALRQPHLKKAEAGVAKAENALARAELDIGRTSLAAPFNCLVVSESVETGQLVESGKEVCRLVGTDKFWIRAALKLSDLARLEIPKDGSPGPVAKVYLDAGEDLQPWEGRVVRVLGDLESRSRLARVLVEVLDPLGLEAGAESKLPMLLGGYVRVEIDAGELEDVLKVPRPALREGNRLWLVGKDNRIRFADAEVLWTHGETLYLRNVLEPGETLVTGGLRSALPGMEVKPQPAGK